MNNIKKKYRKWIKKAKRIERTNDVEYFTIDEVRAKNKNNKKETWIPDYE